MVVGIEIIALVKQSAIWWQVATNFSFNKWANKWANLKLLSVSCNASRVRVGWGSN